MADTIYELLSNPILFRERLHELEVENRYLKTMNKVLSDDKIVWSMLDNPTSSGSNIFTWVNLEPKLLCGLNPGDVLLIGRRKDVLIDDKDGE